MGDVWREIWLTTLFSRQTHFRNIWWVTGWIPGGSRPRLRNSMCCPSLGAIFTHTSLRDFPLPYRASLSCPEGCVLLPTAYHSRAVVGATTVDLQRLRHKAMGDVILLDTFSKIFSPVCEFSTTQPRGRPRHCRAASDNLPRRRVVFN